MSLALELCLSRALRAGFHVTNPNCALCDPQERNLDWFPRMRAMSLVSSDSEGEQNELRNLQEKLESTMKLVTNLSGQLSELKDQVRSSTWLLAAPGASWGSANPREGFPRGTHGEERSEQTRAPAPADLPGADPAAEFQSGHIRKGNLCQENHQS